MDAIAKTGKIVNARDLDAPRVAGTTEDGRFVPRVFCTSAAAQEWATASGLLEPGTMMITNTRDPFGLLIDSVNGQYGGWVIDAGTEHETTLDAPSMRRLYALLALEQFAQLPVLHLVGVGAQFTERAENEVQALVFDSERTATIGIEQLRARIPGVAAQALPTREVLGKLIEAGVTRLNVNNSFTTQRWYARDELTRMLALLGGPDPALQSLPGGEVAGAARPPVAEDPVAWARRYPARAPVPPPGRSDADSERVFGVLRTRIDRKEVSIHEYVRVFGHDVDLYIQAQPKPLEGLVWPQRFENELQKGTTALHTYTREETMVAQVRSQPPEQRAYLRLSGVEVMRWAWAAPMLADFVHVDGYSGTSGAFSIPMELALQFLYPLFRDVERLESVPSVGLPRVTSLPGAHGLRPEVARALLSGFKHLLGAKSRADGAPVFVEHDGGRWLPAFTTDDQFFDYGCRTRAFDGVPVRADAQAPFGRWLTAARDADGVVLDPAAARPLTLDHTTLLALDFWSREGRQPRAADLVTAAAAWLAHGTLTPRAAARAVADWPRWFIAVQRTANGGFNGLRMQQADALPVFPSELSCMEFVGFHTLAGIAKGEWEPVPIVNRWRGSVFHQNAATYTDGVWLAPDADGSKGFHLHGALLDAAIERIHEQLTPRVPGFVAAA
jgi:hypothetical protein